MGTWTGEAINDNAGYGLSGGLDVNGDGTDDVLIGARSYASDASTPYAAGAAYLLLDPWTSGETSLEKADAILYGDGERAEFAYAVLAVDLDEDGTAEMVVGAPGASAVDEDVGAVIVHSDLGRSELDDADIVLTGAEGDDQAGYSLARVDANDDGAPDLVVGAPAGCSGTCDGRVYVVLASEADPLTSGALEDAAAFSLQDRGGELGGTSVSSAGDIDDDGAEDLLIGAPYYSSYSSADAEVAGAAYLISELKGRAGERDMSEGLLIRGYEAYSGVGYAVSSAGDVDGDDQDDLLIGVQYAGFGDSRPGTAIVIYGPVADDITLTDDPRDLPNGGIRFEGVTDGDRAGNSVAGVGDVNADGLSDVLIGAESVGAAAGVNTGAVYLIFGYYFNMNISYVEVNRLALDPGRAP